VKPTGNYSFAPPVWYYVFHNSFLSFNRNFYEPFRNLSTWRTLSFCLKHSREHNFCRKQRQLFWLVFSGNSLVSKKKVNAIIAIMKSWEMSQTTCFSIDLDSSKAFISSRMKMDVKRYLFFINWFDPIDDLRKTVTVKTVFSHRRAKALFLSLNYSERRKYIVESSLIP
jgi:hypothetical protein